jgi:hypothetical protein
MTSPVRLVLGITLLAVTISLTAQTSAPKKKRKPTPKPAPVQAEPVLPPPQQVAPVPLTLAQKPAVAPRVHYQNGQLLIQAENSTLGDILRAVHQQTGAIVELPPNATERVVANLGPGPSRDVLSALLNGSSFNYVMLGSPSNPNDINHLIVTSKAGTDVASNGAQPGLAPAQRSPFAPPNTGSVGGAPPPEDNAAEADSTSDENSSDDTQNDEQPQAEGQAGDSGQQPNGGPAVKTPEQLLQELQRQQQIQQQQQGPQSSPQGFPIPPGQTPPQNQPQD